MGHKNPLLNRELDCIQFVIRPADAILDRFTGLHPLGSLNFWILPENVQNKAREIPSFVLGEKKKRKRSSVASVMGPRPWLCIEYITACFGHAPVYPLIFQLLKRLDMSACDNKLGFVTID